MELEIRVRFSLPSSMVLKVGLRFLVTDLGLGIGAVTNCVVYIK